MTNKSKKPRPGPDKETMAREMMGEKTNLKKDKPKQASMEAKKSETLKDGEKIKHPKKPTLNKERRKPAGPPENLEDLRQTSAAEKSINRAVVKDQADQNPDYIEEVEEKAMEAPIYQAHDQVDGKKDQGGEDERASRPRTGGREVRLSKNKDQKQDQTKQGVEKNHRPGKKGGHLLPILIILVIILLVFFFVDKRRNEKALTGNQALAGDGFLVGSLLSESKD